MKTLRTYYSHILFSLCYFFLFYLNLSFIHLLWLHWVLVWHVGFLLHHAAIELSCFAAYEVLDPQPLIKFMSPVFQGEFLTTGPPRELSVFLF